jgi:hypothetical protein
VQNGIGLVVHVTIPSQSGRNTLRYSALRLLWGNAVGRKSEEAGKELGCMTVARN